MRLLESVLPGGPWPSVALVQVTLVGLVGWLAWLAARRGGPVLRTAILLAALVGMLLAPAVASVAPVWLSLPEWVYLPAAEPSANESESVPAPSAAPDVAPVFALVVTQSPAREPVDAQEPMKQDRESAVPVKAEAVVFNLDSSAEETPPPAHPSTSPRPAWSPARLLGTLWLLGAIACLIRALVRLALLYRCSAQARSIRGKTWTECVESLAKQHGLPAVALRESRHIASPLTLGLFRPVILLPRVRRSWSAEQRALILGHELAHVQRRDFLAGLVAELALCLCWFHPLVRWLAGRLRLEQEYAADAWVASTADNPTDYIRCLARMALELERGHGPLAPAFWRRRPEILRRIEMLRRNPKGLPTRLGRRTGWMVAALAAAACLAAGVVGPLHSAPEGQKATEAGPQASGKAAADRQGDPLPEGALARLGTTRMRHGAEVTFVAFGPGGKTLLTAGRDNTIRLWDLATGKELRRFAVPKPVPVKPPEGKGKKKPDQAEIVMQMMAGGGNDGGNARLAITADGKTLAVGRGNVIQFYNVETGEALRQIQGQAGGFNGLLFSPDGKTLAARSGNNTLILWETESGKELHQIKPPPRPQRDGIVFIIGGGDANAPGMTFRPDGKTLAAAMTDDTKEGQVHAVKFWDVATGKEVRQLKTKAEVNVVALSPDGEMASYGIGNVLFLCDAKTGKELRQIKTTGGRIVTAAFTPDGKTLAIRGRNQRVDLWDVQTGKEVHHLSDAQPNQRSGGNGFVFMTAGVSGPETRALAISADGKRIVSAAGSTVRIWESATGKEVSLSDGHRQSPRALVLSRDGKMMISWGGDRVVRRWESATGKLLGAFPAPPRTTRAALSPDGRTVALANADNTIRIHDAATGKELHQLKAHANGTSALVFSHDGKMLASRSGGDNSILLFEVATGRELRRIAQRPEREPAQGTILIFGGGGGSGGNGPGLAFSPDGKLLAAPGPDGRNSVKTLVLIDVASGKALRKIELPQAVTSLAFSPDGRTLATEHADRAITLWEVASGKMRGQLGKVAAERPQQNGRAARLVIDLDGVGGNVNEPAGPIGLAFSPDGRVLVARGANRAVKVWDVIAGKEIGQLKGHEGGIQTVAFAPDGKTLASGATDTTILLWDAADPLKELTKVRTVEVPAAEMKTLWDDLAGEDGVKAFRGVLQLSAAPQQTVPFLGERLKPAARIDPKKIDGWIGELDSEKYAVRQAAAANLIQVGEQSVPALRKVLASSPALETRKRIEELLEKLAGGTLSTEQLRLVRAVEALERIGTPEARQVLQKLSEGAPGTLSTREAEAALNRLRSEPRP